MKTTIDLPVDLVREMKLRAVHEGRKLKDVASEIFRLGLSQSGPLSGPAKKRVTLPLIQCRHPAAPLLELTPDRVAELLLKQEVDSTL